MKINESNILSALRTLFRSFRYRNYRLFFGGQTISLIGTWTQRIALPWLVYQLTGSAFLLGLVGFAGQIPTFVLSPFAGVMTDRWNRYHLLIGTQVLSMIQAFILTILYFTGTIAIWNIIFLSLILGCINAFDVPARQSFVIDLIEKRADLGNAIALNSSMVNSARLIGPSVAGILIAFAGEGICFLVNALSYLFVLLSLLLMKVTPKTDSHHKKQVFSELKEGFSYVFRFAPMKYILLLLSVVSFMGMSYTILMPVFAKEILHGSSHTYGFLMGAAGLGALTGALYLASRKGVIGLERVIPLAAGTFGLGLIALSFSRFVWLSLVLLIFIGLGMMLQMASSNTIIQTIVDDNKRGRVMSIYTMAFLGVAPFGSFLAGALAKIIGTPNTLLIGGIFCIIGALIFARKLSELRKIIRPIYTKLGIIVPEISKGIQIATEPAVPPEE
jgi:MFS family permease